MPLLFLTPLAVLWLAVLVRQLALQESALQHEITPMSQCGACAQAYLQTCQKLLFYTHSVGLFVHRRADQYPDATGQDQANALSIAGQEPAREEIFQPYA